MCGIFGYVGKQDSAAGIILDGLKLLEYRGYDSWGIAVKKEKKIVLEKHVGKIGEASVHLPKSSIGIGHTRWATHGGVTQENAHPHLACTKDIAVIHNGIVENFEELKVDLKQKGHHFSSETDTEVIVHLVEEFLKTNGFATSVRKTFNLLRGLNAIVVLNAKSSEIIAAKNGSPLVVGENAQGLFVASDATGIIKHTKNLYFLKDDEMVILGEKVKLVTLTTGKESKAEFEEVTWNIEDVNKGVYAHFMLKEINEQPRVVKNLVENYTNQITYLAKMIKNAKGTFFIGAGTAYHASMAGAYLFSKVAHWHVNTTVASEFNYLEDFLTKESLIVALSQSGETIDVIEPLNRARQKGSKIVALVNTLGSTIYRMADYKILLGAGPEKAVASTKAYVAKLTALCMLSFFLANRKEEGIQILQSAVLEVERLCDGKTLSQIKDIVQVVKNSRNIYTIGRGTSYATALEAALKIKEVTYVPTEGLAGGELKHGTIALISQGTPCIVFAPKDETHEATISNAMEIKARGGLIIGVSSHKAPVFDHFIEVRDCKEATLIPQIIPAQLLAYYLAVEKGNDPDMPRNLAKSVTVK